MVYSGRERARRSGRGGGTRAAPARSKSRSLGLGLAAAKQRGGRGVGKELYSAQNGKKIAKVSGLERLSSARFVPNRVLPDYGREGEGRCAVGPARQPKGRWVPVTSGRKEREGGCVRGPRERGNGEEGAGRGVRGAGPRRGSQGLYFFSFYSFLFHFIFFSVFFS